MKTKLLLSLCVTFFSINTAYSESISAYRAPEENWQLAAEKSFKQNKLPPTPSILSTAIAWNSTTLDNQQILLNQTPLWPNYQTIKEQFDYLKDNHYLMDPINLNLNRTIPWRYPVDWCFERAAAAVSLYNNSALPRPAKIFAFGNLALFSPFGNGTNGLLSFWYHVAPIVRDRQTNLVYVLDPSLNDDAPLPLENWLKQLISQSNKRALRVNICAGYATTPDQDCVNATSENERQNAEDVVNRLPSEWDHVQARGLQIQSSSRSENGKRIYGVVNLNYKTHYFAINDKLIIQYKFSHDTEWNTLIDISDANSLMLKYAYLPSEGNIPRIPIGSIFGKPNRSAKCDCHYFSCSCSASNDEEKIELRITLNNDVIKQCTYQYPKNRINTSYIGPDIQYKFNVSSGKIDPKNYEGNIEGCN